jgi:hypothetical protein
MRLKNKLVKNNKINRPMKTSKNTPLFSIIFAFLSFSTTISLQAQEVTASLSSAKSAYQTKNLEETRFALENALKEVNMEIGKQALALLPLSLGQLKADPKNDDVAGMAVLFAGLNVMRDYNSATENATLTIITDSPMLAGISAILTMPAMMLNNDEQKVVKIAGYKSLIQKNKDENDKIVGYSLQVPFNNSLLSLDYNGAISESEFTNIANSLPVTELVKLLQ